MLDDRFPPCVRHLPLVLELPPMRCDEGCRGCCSEAVTCTEEEMVAVIAYANARGIVPQESDPQMCPWYQGGRCAVHPVRPTVCQAFGHFPELECERGYNVDVSLEQRRALLTQMRSLGPKTRFLHEVRTTGSVRVDERVWRDVQANRERAGLPPLKGKETTHG